MSDFFQRNKVPVLVTVVALTVSTLIGLVPVWQRNAEADAPVARADQVDVLEARIAELEAALAAPPATAPAAVEGTDEKLRQELDLIVKGLVNQTGRVSRLRSQIATMTDANGAPKMHPRTGQEIALAKRGLANLTRRINQLDATAQAQASLPGDVDRLQLQVANIDRALGNVAGRINGLNAQIDALESLPGDVNRLVLQMQNVDRALANLARRQNTASKDLDVMRPVPAGVETLEQRMAIVDRAFHRVAGSLNTAKSQREDLTVAIAALQGNTSALLSATDQDDQRAQLTDIQLKLSKLLDKLADD